MVQQNSHKNCTVPLGFPIHISLQQVPSEAVPQLFAPYVVTVCEAVSSDLVFLHTIMCVYTYSDTFLA